MSRTVSSIVGGKARADAPGGRVTIPNPAQLGEAVAVATASAYVGSRTAP